MFELDREEEKKVSVDDEWNEQGESRQAKHYKKRKQERKEHWEKKQ